MILLSRKISLHMFMYEYQSGSKMIMHLFSGTAASLPFQLGKKGKGRRQRSTKSGLQPGCKASEKVCEACGHMNVNAKKYCGGCGVNLREMKAQKKKEEMQELQEKGINDPGYYLGRMRHYVSATVFFLYNYS